MVFSGNLKFFRRPTPRRGWAMPGAGLEPAFQVLYLLDFEGFFSIHTFSRSKLKECHLLSLRIAAVGAALSLSACTFLRQQRRNHLSGRDLQDPGLDPEPRLRRA